MNAIDIISHQISTDGFNINWQELRDLAISDVESGKDAVFQYGNVVFTEGVEDAYIHVYSCDADKWALYKATRQFSKDGWSVGHEKVFAPIVNPRMRLFAARMKMRYFGYVPPGYRMYYADRSFYE